MLSHSDDDYGTPSELTRWLASCDDPAPVEHLEAWAQEGEDPPDETPPPALDPKDPWRSRGAAEIFGGPMGNTFMLCPGLDLGPGRPWGCWGAPGSGKTVAIQALALAIASGRDVWGLLPCTRGRVVHMSWDLGFRAIKARYRQLANGMRLAASDLEGQLVVCAHPAVSLSSKGAEKAFAKRVEGFQLAIIDNLRDASPGLKENDSDFGERITLFGRVCELAGCTALYLHHTRKEAGAGIDAARGSSAIPAATGAAWVWQGEKGDPRKITQARRHDMSDRDSDPIWLVQEEAGTLGACDMGLGADGEPRQALRMIASYDEPQNPLYRAVERALALAPAGLSASGLRRAVKGQGKSIDAACKAMLKKGLIVDIGDDNEHKYRLSSEK